MEDIKYKIAVAALGGGQPLSVAREYYEWVTASENPLFRDDVQGFLAGRGFCLTRARNVCRTSGIKTVGELYGMGGVRFRDLKDVGDKVCDVVDRLFSDRYEINDWKGK